MIDISKINYSSLDRPEILMFLFHPRPEFGRSISSSDEADIMIPNDIFIYGLKDYIAAIQQFVNQLKAKEDRS